MVLSSWRGTWREDVKRVVHSMSKREKSVLWRAGLLSTPGRRAFVSASERLELDVVHSAYLMEQTAQTLNEIEANPP